LKALVIGYGSIGRRHDEVLKETNLFLQIDIVSKQTIINRMVFKYLDEVKNLDSYDYFVIASETNKHYEQLKYLDNALLNKKILCEKPLFESSYELEIKNNKIYVGYVLRYHPLLQQLKFFLKDEELVNVNINCGSYLPTWRTNIDYRDSYSAKKDKGGGVLLDLSHEIDYIYWLFGKIKELKSYQLKVSDLEIDSDDLMVAIGKTSEGVIINLSIDYISKLPRRKVIVDTNDKSFELDFIKNTLHQKDKRGLEQKYEFSNLERNYLFEQMHRAILGNGQHACTYEDGMEVMKTIVTIQEQN